MQYKIKSIDFTRIVERRERLEYEESFSKSRRSNPQQKKEVKSSYKSRRNNNNGLYNRNKAKRYQ
jgi:hypothetical protein